MTEINSNAADINFPLNYWVHLQTQQTCSSYSSSHLLLRCQEHNQTAIGCYKHCFASSSGIFCANQIASDDCYQFSFSAIQSNFRDPASRWNSSLDLVLIITNFVS